MALRILLGLAAALVIVGAALISLGATFIAAGVVLAVVVFLFFFDVPEQP